MATFQEVRTKFPQYNNLSDGEFAYRLWNKEYKDKLAMGQFADALNMTQDQFGQMIGYGKSVGYEPTEMSGSTWDDTDKRLFQMFEGQTLSWGDEVVAGVVATIDTISNIAKGRPHDWKKTYSTYKAEMLNELKQYQKDAPWESLGIEITGGFLSPLMMISGPKALMELYNKGGFATRGLINSARAFTGGAAYGAGVAEGSLEEIADRAYTDGLVSLFSSPIGSVVGGLLRKVKGGNLIANGFDEMSLRPTLQLAKQNKDRAYDLLDKSGFVFKSDDFQTAFINAMNDIDQNALPKIFGKLDPKSTNPYEQALHYLNQQTLKDQSISNMETIRQTLYQYFLKADKADKQAVYKLYQRTGQFIDDMLPKDGSGKTIADGVRLAASQYKKALVASKAFEKAASESAGVKDPVIIYQKAIRKLLDDPEVQMHYTPTQIEQLEKLGRGGFTRDFKQMIGRYAPTSNNMLLLMHGFGFMLDPAFLAITGATTAAKSSVRKELGEESVKFVDDLVGISRTKAEVTPPKGRIRTGISAAKASEREEVQDTLVTPLP